jgi:hypothetical protein
VNVVADSNTTVSCQLVNQAGAVKLHSSEISLCFVVVTRVGLVCVLVVMYLSYSKMQLSITLGIELAFTKFI